MVADRQRKLLPVVGALSLLLVGLVGWNLYSFRNTNSRTSTSASQSQTSIATQAQSANADINSADLRNGSGPTATGIPSILGTNDAGAAQGNVSTGKLSDPFKPAAKEQTTAPSDEESGDEEPEVPNGGTQASGSNPATAQTSFPPPFVLPPANVSPSATRVEQKREGLYLTGVIMDPAAPVAIIEGEQTHLMRPRESLPNRITVVAINANNIIVAKDKQRRRINIGERIPWKD